MEAVRSKDGTPIAFERSGEGPALVIVGGPFDTRLSSRELTPLLANNYTVYEYDRRGRGDSGNSPIYSIEREVEDLAAIVTVAGGSAYLYGHDSGGALALEAASRGVHANKVAVWEPPYTADNIGDGGSSELLEQVGGQVAAGDNDRAAEVFLEGSGTTAESIELMKVGPEWARIRALAPTLVYDLTLRNHGFVPVERFSSIHVPTIAFAGGTSPEWAARAARVIAGAIPDAIHETVDTENHDPDARTLATLLTEYFRG